jgi:hypothetical protein
MSAIEASCVGGAQGIGGFGHVQSRVAAAYISIPNPEASILSVVEKLPKNPTPPTRRIHIYVAIFLYIEYLYSLDHISLLFANIGEISYFMEYSE